MRTMGVTEFKANCLRLLKELEAGGEGFTLTRRGVPIVDVMPHRAAVEATVEERRERYQPGRFKHMVRIVGDLTAPLEESWISSGDDPLLAPEPRAATSDERAA